MVPLEVYMPAYVVVEIKVKDPTVFEDYKQLSPGTLDLYGGKYLARGGQTEVLEGNWSPQRLVILEFESMEQARKWYMSPEYTHAKSFRVRSADSNFVLTEGSVKPN
jgi:uncharacterized protein (DUF1330 family)